jgi:hypothetical protein
MSYTLIPNKGRGRCGWIALDYLLKFDIQKYMADVLMAHGIPEKIFKQSVRRLTSTYTFIRVYLHNVSAHNQWQKLATLLRSKDTRAEFNDAWALMLVCSPYFIFKRLNLFMYNPSEQRFYYYTEVPGERTQWIGLYGGDGHWCALESLTKKSQ